MDDITIGILYKKYYQAMIGLAMRILGNKDDAEDVVQDVFLDALRADNEEVAEPKSYLMTSVSNRAKNIITRRRGRERHLGYRDSDISSDGFIQWYDGKKLRRKRPEEFNAILDVPDSYRLSWYDETGEAI